MANNLWDQLHSIRVELLQFPEELQSSSLRVENQSTSDQSVDNVFSIIPPRAATPSTKLTHRRSMTSPESAIYKDFVTRQASVRPSSSATAPGDTTSQVVSSRPTFRHCYGKDSEDQIRLSMGSLTMDQQIFISKLQLTTTKESFIRTLSQAFQDDKQF